jgi:hypothetical protein
MVYIQGRPDHKLPHAEMIDHLVQLVEDRVDAMETENRD